MENEKRYCMIVYDYAFAEEDDDPAVRCVYRKFCGSDIEYLTEILEETERLLNDGCCIRFIERVGEN